MYIVIETFRDKDGKIYNKGGEWPGEGKASKTRASELLGKNKYNRPFISEKAE